ncbi:OmpA family protein [candidate division KSB1 bacterium]|nr:OmpA family protein [candidate division KSB1 bacterium]
MTHNHIKILGIVGFLIIFWLCIKTTVHIIEKDIYTRTSQILKDEGFDNINIDVSGRDISIKGHVASESERQQLIQTVQRLYGVRKFLDLSIVKRENTNVISPANKPEKLCLYFNSRSFDLDTTHISLLQKLVKKIKDNNNFKLEINGFTDAEGVEKYNLHLSKKRAEIVYNYFLQNDIKKEQIKINAFGESMPISDNETSQGRAKNRRVEINLLEGE